MVVEFIVPAAAARRVDQVIRAHFPNVSRRLQQEWFAKGLVRLDGEIAKKGAPVTGGQLCRVDFAPELLRQNRVEPGRLSILLETEHVVVVDKPARMATAALEGSTVESVAAHLLELYPQMNGIGYSVWDAGLIHRLDTDTSGVVVAAKSSDVFQELVRALRRGSIEKTYLAWVTRVPSQESGTITTWLRPDPHHRRRMIPAHPNQKGARACETCYEVVGIEGSLGVIRAKAPTATRHQVRAHLASIGSPLAGDELYRGEQVPGLERHALHAECVAYSGSETCGAFDCRAEVPADLVTLTPGCVERLATQ